MRDRKRGPGRAIPVPRGATSKESRRDADSNSKTRRWCLHGLPARGADDLANAGQIVVSRGGLIFCLRLKHRAARRPLEDRAKPRLRAADEFDRLVATDRSTFDRLDLVSAKTVRSAVCLRVGVNLVLKRGESNIVTKLTEV